MGLINSTFNNVIAIGIIYFILSVSYVFPVVLCVAFIKNLNEVIKVLICILLSIY